MTNAALRGKPDAGNPHVRFDEGEVASAATPSRGSLLYNAVKTMLVCAIAGRLLASAYAAGGFALAPLKEPAVIAEKCPVSEKVRGHENIEWQISYAYHLADANMNLPRVLLVGDSICNNYQSEVRRLLEGKTNVSYWISSYCVTSPNYLKFLSLYLEEAKYDVVHFNNGLHSLQTPTDAYAKGICASIQLIKRKQPDARIVWCSSTPLKDARKTAKVKELNAAAAKVVAEAGGVETNDLFALLEPLDREANWRDEFHHRKETCKMEANQVAAAILRADQAKGE